MRAAPGRRRAAALREERGAAAVEFALVMTILFLLLFGILEWGRVEAEITIFEGAAREGARRAAVGEPYEDVVAAVQNHSNPFAPTPPISVAVADTAENTCSGTDTVGKEVTVSWSQSFSVSIPLWKDVSFSRAIQGVFRCER
ncbi:MAG TPA: TadE/TadG family type IV pilus assembly protein [Actinomycetota bacterium]|nr:TadE/TadG family type IV pilus assembly protein [Actinomycetota bacterium]